MDEPIPLTDFSIELRDDHLVKCRGSATFHCPHSDGAHLVGKQCPMSNLLWNFVRETFLVKSYHKKKPVTKSALKKFENIRWFGNRNKLYTNCIHVTFIIIVGKSTRITEWILFERTLKRWRTNHIYSTLKKISTCVGIVFSSVVISVIPSNNGAYNVLVTLQLIFHLERVLTNCQLNPEKLWLHLIWLSLRESLVEKQYL